MQSSTINADLPVLTEKAKAKLSEFLSRLYNNNESGYFFLESSDTPLPSDCCAFLNLSIAIKASEHYRKCLDAKVLQLTDTFQAKLGWLVGQMYSRVGTNDWPHQKLISKVATTLENAAIWIPDASAKKLNDLLPAPGPDGPLAPISEAEIRSALKSIPTRKAQILEQVSAVANKVLTGSLPDRQPQELTDLAQRMVRRLEGDAVFTNLTK